MYLRGHSLESEKSVCAKPIEFVEVEEGTSSEPFIVIPKIGSGDLGMLQAVLDGLWEAGLRPSNHRDFTQELKATKTHLEDMRQLVFKDNLRGLL